MNKHHSYRKAFFHVSLSFIFLFASFAASAVTLLSDDRYVEEFGSINGLVTQTPGTPFQNWAVTGQVSQVGTDSLLGVGSGEGFSDFDFFIRESVFDITFNIAVPTLLNLEGTTFGEDGDFGFGEASVTLIGGNTLGDILFSSASGSGEFLVFEFDQILAPGTYRLLLQTNITPGGFGTFAEWTFSADFTAQPIPIPAVGWLFGLLVLGLYRQAAKKGV